MSYAIALRNAIYARLAPLHPYVTLRKVAMPQVQSGSLPALSVFVASGDAVSDGEGNVGNIRLAWTDTIGISVIRGFEDPLVLEGVIDAECEEFLETLLGDPDFTNVGRNRLFDSIVSVKKRWLFPQDGETYFAELRLEIAFLNYAGYSPRLNTPLTRVDVTAEIGDSSFKIPSRFAVTQEDE